MTARRPLRHSVSLKVNDEPIAEVIARIEPALRKGIVYSRTALTTAEGKEHTVTAHLSDLPPELALDLVAQAVGLEAVVTNKYVLIKPRAVTSAEYLGDAMDDSYRGDGEDDDLPFGNQF